MVECINKILLLKYLSLLKVTKRLKYMIWDLVERECRLSRFSLLIQESVYTGLVEVEECKVDVIYL